jgi:hypothetical protein
MKMPNLRVPVPARRCVRGQRIPIRIVRTLLDDGADVVERGGVVEVLHGLRQHIIAAFSG